MIGKELRGALPSSISAKIVCRPGSERETLALFSRSHGSSWCPFFKDDSVAERSADRTLGFFAHLLRSSFVSSQKVNSFALSAPKAWSISSIAERSGCKSSMFEAADTNLISVSAGADERIRSQISNLRRRPATSVELPKCSSPSRDLGLDASIRLMRSSLSSSNEWTLYSANSDTSFSLRSSKQMSKLVLRLNRRLIKAVTTDQ